METKIDYAKAGQELREAYLAYKATSPAFKISLSSFAAGWNAAKGNIK